MSLIRADLVVLLLGLLLCVQAPFYVEAVLQQGALFPNGVQLSSGFEAGENCSSLSEGTLVFSPSDGTILVCVNGEWKSMLLAGGNDSSVGSLLITMQQRISDLESKVQCASTGRYDIVSESCICSGGYYRANSEEVLSCAPVGTGFYSPAEDTNRYACPADTYSDTTVASECTACPEGMTTSGATESTACGCVGEAMQVGNVCISGAIMHLDASVSQSVIGNPISEWRDLTSNGNHATQSSGSLRPSHACPSGELCRVRYDGNVELTAGSSVIPNGPHTIMIVVEPTANDDEKGLLTTCSGTSCTGYRFLVKTGSYQHTCFRSSPGNPNFAVEASDDATLNTMKVVTATWDGSTNTDAVKIFVSSTLRDTSHASVSAASLGSHQQNLAVGAQYETARRFRGDIAELFIFNRVLTDLERSSLVGYLESKWSI